MIFNPVSRFSYPIAGQGFKKPTLFQSFFGCFASFILVIGILMPCLALANSDGITLFEQEKYGLAVHFFSEELKTQPTNPVTNFYLGRSFLALNQADKAIDYLKKATNLTPKNPDYQFWLGVGYWANMEFEKERQIYLTALKLDPDHLMANLYLGHNYMDRNQWKSAQNQYERVLAINPAVPDALFNRALVFRRLKKNADETNAWKLYLSRYRSGKWALQAAEHLNGYGDFSYRKYLLGSRMVVVPAINFESAGSTLKTESLQAIESIGDVLTKKRTLSLNVITYVKDNSNLAKSRAKIVKKYILEMFPEIKPSRLTVSWFGVPEKIDLGDRTYVLNESVNIITRIKY
jgi:tetratricopeptide (TPR) repeat protein